MLPVGFVICSSITCWFVLLLLASLRPQHLGQNLQLVLH